MFPHLRDNIKTILLDKDGCKTERPQIKVNFTNKPNDKINSSSSDFFQSKRRQTFQKYSESSSRIFTGGVGDSRGFSSSRRITPKDNISGVITYAEGPRFRNEVVFLLI